MSKRRICELHGQLRQIEGAADELSILCKMAEEYRKIVWTRKKRKARSKKEYLKPTDYLSLE